MELRLVQGSERQEVSVVVGDRNVLVGQGEGCDLLITQEAPEVLLELIPVPDSNPFVVLRRGNEGLWFLPGEQAEQRHTLSLGHFYEMRPGDRIVLGDWFSSSTPYIALTFYR